MGERAEITAPRPLEHREWLCAIGLSNDSRRVLHFATQVAQEIQARLTVIHAVQAQQRGQSIELGLEEKVLSIEKREALERIADLQRAANLNAMVRIAAGSVKEALLETARQSDADVLIIGRSPRPGALGRMYDLTYAVVRDSSFPVLSV